MIGVTTSNRDIVIGYAAAFGAALAYGTVAVIGRKIVNDFSSPMIATSFSMVIGTLVVAAMFHKHAALDLRIAPKRAWLFVALAGLSATWGVSFWFLALNEAPVVLVAPLSSTYPLVSIVLTHFFLQRLEKVTMRTIWGTLLVVSGVVLVAIGAN